MNPVLEPVESLKVVVLPQVHCLWKAIKVVLDPILGLAGADSTWATVMASGKVADRIMLREDFFPWPVRAG